MAGRRYGETVGIRMLPEERRLVEVVSLRERKPISQVVREVLMAGLTARLASSVRETTHETGTAES